MSTAIDFTKSQMEITPKEMSIVRSAIDILKEEEEKEEKDHLTIGLLNKYIEFVKAFNGGNGGKNQFANHIKNVDEFHLYDCQDNEYCKQLKTHIINNSALSGNRSKPAAAAPHHNLQRMDFNPQTYSSSGLGVGGGKRKVSKKSRKSKSRKSKSRKSKSKMH
jgi:hypothetical protein